ncbi:antibiotic biosynthesis monooxygenase [Solwaraspora sp. WMMD406]|uniref:antibiotic biosynthesis monooxygenase family protein n=1 Tax=Solwaraspora sp. WMMD406 TaxID=3016095 RepID=UPI002417C3CD|nr:antibiotic biosynthesis monooxygenase family protein [Solwaraspora sp. WMMD406]MDG4765864.1 antibiotic biosynthesis monooxygenase [Solwaraspora sp. WMMD406]
MSAIRIDDGYLTLFNMFYTNSGEDQDKLFDQWRGLPPANVQKGLIAGNFHRGLDGRSVVNYAQWESLADYEAFLAEAGTRSRLGQALAFSHMESIPTEVVHTWDPAPELTIDKPWFTVVIIVRAAPEHQATVLAEMTNDPPELGDTPGYVSHAVHRGLAGEHVIKYAQWADEESFRSFLSRPQQEQHSSPAVETTVELHFTRLEYIRERS